MTVAPGSIPAALSPAIAARQSADSTSNSSGSPRLFTASDIHFEPGLNEELAATAIWGAQQAELRGEGRFDGVFGLWYGKGPGVDRWGDVFRHANLAGTSRHGGVLAADGRRSYRGILDDGASDPNSPSSTR